MADEPAAEIGTHAVTIDPPGRLKERSGAGAQRLCCLGTANAHVLGRPHDAMYPLQRLVHWMADDDIMALGSA